MSRADTNDFMSEQEIQDLIQGLRTRRGGDVTDETLMYYLVLTREIRMQQGIIALLESGDLEAALIHGHDGTMANDYEMRLTTQTREQGATDERGVEGLPAQCGDPGPEQWPLVYECAQGHMLCAFCGKDGCTVCAMADEESLDA